MKRRTCTSIYYTADRFGGWALLRLWFSLALIAMALAIGLAAPAVAAPQPLTVFAAASLKNAMDRLAATFEAETATKVRVAYAGSSTLARQIALGAPADVFVCANADWMDHLGAQGSLRADTRVRVTGNRLVLIVPAGDAPKLALTSELDLAARLDDRYLAMANTDAVPAGLYGKAALQSLGLWAQLAGRIAQTEDVRAALALVSRGEAAMGIVYASDAVAAGDRVKVLASFPAASHPAIVYPAAVLARSSHPAAAAFVEYIAAPARRAVFARWGFSASP